MSVSRGTIRELAVPYVSRETRDRLAAYVDLLGKWNSRVNLVGRGDAALFWPRHIVDSLQLMELIPADVVRSIDLGSGAGLPGLVLAVATGIHFDLVESDQRKAAFLLEAARVTEAPVTVIPHRIEAVSISQASVVTSRALASLPSLLGFSDRLLAEHGCCLFSKGQGVEREIQEALSAWTMNVERYTSCTNPTGIVLRISEVRRVR